MLYSDLSNFKRLSFVKNLRHCHNVSKVVVLFYMSTNNKQELKFLHILKNTYYHQLSINLVSNKLIFHFTDNL